MVEEAMDCMRDMLVPLADILTPNMPEAAALVARKEAKDREDMRRQAKALQELGARNIYLKGGHLASNESPDLILTPHAEYWLESRRIDTKNTHGTGCCLSASIAANRAAGASEIDAAKAAKSYITNAIAAANRLQVGHGHGPVYHFL